MGAAGAPHDSGHDHLRAAGPIALDAMGGDHGAAVAVAGALRARAEYGIDTILVGRSGELELALKNAGESGSLAIVEASQVIAMSEDSAIAVRSKPDSSICVAARLVAAGKASAVVSAGPTGATLAAALLVIGRAPGVRRPVVAAVIPVVSGDRRADLVLVDAGGSADPQPDALVAFARMGIAYARVRGVSTPRVGLLNVGAEPGKGNLVARTAHALLSEVDGFVGNTEPDAAINGAVDVLVADGFTGNVFLKTVEALGGLDESKRAGAAVLLGVAGEVLVSHGAAGEAQIARALRSAAVVAHAGLSVRIAEQLAAASSSPEQPPATLTGAEHGAS
ncbi:MAG TPA: hypothetical protein VML96_07915 [Egibacteraceae bacterium]|nr:hypothetical protein [Egibacteraceae bacterium]